MIELFSKINPEAQIRLDRAYGAVALHYATQKLSHLPLPDPERLEDVDDVAQTIINHTGFAEAEVTESMPIVQMLMGECREVLQGLPDSAESA